MTQVDELDLETFQQRDDLEPDAFVAALASLAQRHWLAKWSHGYLVTRYDDVVALLRERRLHQASQLVASLAGADNALLSPLRRESILSAEGDTHSRLRRLVAAPFSATSIDELRPFMVSYLDELLTRVTSTNAGYDLEVAATFSTYPIAVICALLGVERADWDLFSEWAETTFLVFSSTVKGNEQRIVDQSRAFTSYCRDLIDERRRHLGSDLLSQLIEAESSGERLSNQELVSLVQSIIAAGTDTTRNQLTTMMALVARRPEEWSTLDVDSTVEESLRYLNAIRFVIRRVDSAFTYRDVTFPVNTLVAFNLASVNRDAAHFARAELFDPTRPGARAHLTFSSGRHHCLGASLARAELREALGAMQRHWATIALREPVTWKDPRSAVWGASRVVLGVSASLSVAR